MTHTTSAGKPTVGHRVDPLPQRLTARPGEQFLELPPVLERDHLAAGRGEHTLQFLGGDAGHDPVQRLPVQVNDPDHLPQFTDGGIEHWLPHRTLVQLGIADQ